MRAAIVRAGIVENVILLDPELQVALQPEPSEEGELVTTRHAFDPGEGAELIELGEDMIVGPGWTFDGATFAPPPVEAESE